MAKWVRLEDFRCPVGNCVGKNQAGSWYCAEDSSSIYISQTGYMRCSRGCEGNWDHYGLISTWRFDCGNHGDHPFNRFKEADMEGFVFALSSAVQLMKAAGAVWVGQLCAEIERQYGPGYTFGPQRLYHKGSLFSHPRPEQYAMQFAVYPDDFAYWNSLHMEIRNVSSTENHARFAGHLATCKQDCIPED